MAKAEEFGEQSVGLIQLSSMLRKSPQWISKLTREGVLTKDEKNKYHLAETLAAYIDHVNGAAEDTKGPRKADFDREIAEIKRDKARIELEELRGNVHFSGDVQRVMSDMIIKCKTKLLSIPSRVAPKVEGEHPAVIKRMIEDEIYTALSELAEYKPSMFVEKAGEDDDEEENDTTL